MGYGIAKATTTVDAVSQCVIAVTSADRGRRRARVHRARPESPAAKAGLEPGDRIVSFNGTPITGWAQLQKLIRANGDGDRHVVVVVRDGSQLTLRPTPPASSARPDPDDPRRSRGSGFLGITPVQVTERQGPGYVVDTMASATWDTLKALGALPVKVYHVGRAAVGLEERDTEGPDERGRRRSRRRGDHLRTGARSRAVLLGRS